MSHFRIADASENFLNLASNQTALIFQPDQEHELLMPIVSRNVGGLMLRGAQDELAAVERLRGPQKSPFDDIELFDQDMSETTRLAIRAALDELTQQTYWRSIQDETEANLTRIIQESIDAGDSGHAMSVRIRDQLGGFEARKRGWLIARTETTGALNAGHEAQREGLVQAGLVTGKQWLAIIDQDARADHAALDGRVVAPKEDFAVGGSLAPYPGHWSLPAGQRINCRCTTVSVIEITLGAEPCEF